MQGVKVLIQCSLLNYYLTSNKTIYLETTTYLFFCLFSGKSLSFATVFASEQL
jgi:hypothetical protein